MCSISDNLPLGLSYHPREAKLLSSNNSWKRTSPPRLIAGNNTRELMIKKIKLVFIVNLFSLGPFRVTIDS
jgi:hypothetical protein